MSTAWEEKTKKTVRGGVWRRLFSYMKPHLPVMSFCLLLVLVLTGFDLLRPMLIGDAIDLFADGGSLDDLLSTAGLYAVVLFLGVATNIAQSWLLQKTGQSIILSVRKDLYRHILSLSCRYFDLTPVGKLLTRLTNNVEALNRMFSGILVQLFRSVVMIAGYAIVMLLLDVRLALWSFILLPAVAVLTVLFRRMARAAFRRTTDRLTELNTFLSEHIYGMRIIQIFGQQRRKYEQFCQKSGSLYDAMYRENLIFAIFRPLIYILRVISLMIALCAGSAEVLGGVVSVGTLYVFAQYIQSFFDPIESLAEQFSTLQSSMASAEKVFSVMDEEPMVKEEEHPILLPKISGRIEFFHVWFAYDGKNYVLRDVSFVITPGQKVAFVGATGAGKTSILNLIGRYYDIQKGQILIDGIDIRLLSKQQLRRAIGQMQQDVFLFEGDISQNVRLHDEKITDEEIKAACEYVNASSFIEKLSQQYHEPVKERGVTFSAGERQLLSFARVLAHDPAILVMDEATANIDTQTEILIEDALDRLMQGRTTIMVAHRLSTIRHADCIMVLHKGKIRERGTHEELLAKGGIYQKLYALQVQGAPEDFA